MLVSHVDGKLIMPELFVRFLKFESEHIGLNFICFDIYFWNFFEFLGEPEGILMVFHQFLLPILKVFKTCLSENSSLSQIAA